MPTKNAALLLSGGGDKGAWQAGAEERLREAGYQWGAGVAGVSVGALNGAMIARAQQRVLKDVWWNLTPDMIQRGGPGAWRALQLLVFKSKRGLWDLDPLRELLEKHVAPHEERVPFKAGVVDLWTRRFAYNPTGDVVTDVLASASMPLIFGPVEGRLVDGGVRDIAPMREVMAWEPDEIVVVLCSPLSHPEHSREQVHEEAPGSFVEDGEVTLATMTDEILRNDVQGFARLNRLVKQAAAQGVELTADDGRAYRHVPLTVVAPEEPLGPSLQFEAARSRRRWRAGRARAEELLAAA